MRIGKIRGEYGIAVLCVALMTALHALALPLVGPQHNVPLDRKSVV